VLEGHTDAAGVLFGKQKGEDMAKPKKTQKKSKRKAKPMLVPPMGGIKGKEGCT
jgi:hypothetical protein